MEGVEKKKIGIVRSIGREIELRRKDVGNEMDVIEINMEEIGIKEKIESIGERDSLM